MPETLLQTQVIDACVHHSWPSEAEVAGYLTAEWREYVGRPGSLRGGHGARPIHLQSPHRFPGAGLGVNADDRSRALPDAPVDHAVLVQEAGVFLSAEPNPHLAREVARAANDWLIDRWLDDAAGQRFGAVVAANQNPEEAAKEILRAGAHPRMVAVLLGASGLSKGFGNPIYDPVHRAAAELGLPLLVHADGDTALDSLLQSSAAGQAATYSEARILSCHALMTHLASFVGHGVFERYPGLRVLLVGGAMSWLPAFVWRFDADYKGLHRETPWVKRLPSDYVREHIRVTTYPLDTRSDPEGLRRGLATFDGMEDVLCFASGYPRPDAVDPSEVAGSLPEAWHAKVFKENAAALFGFDAR
jgi:predicted TIM-barrel fold metal-dependent hydrolase